MAFRPIDTPPEQPTAGPLASEPVVLTNAVTALVIAVLLLLREFGVPLTEGQHLAIVGLVGALFLAVGTYLAWRRVTPLVDPKDNQGNALVPEKPNTSGRTSLQ